MAIEVTIPRPGWSTDEVVFGEWLVEDGMTISAGDLLFTVESDKALQEVESIDSGRLHILPDGPQPGDTAPVGQLIGWLLAANEPVPSGGTAPQAAAANNTSLPVSTANAATARQPDDSPVVGSGAIDPVTRNAEGTPAISPRAARLATQHGIDWRSLTGSGRTGRIREADIREAMSGSAASAADTAIPQNVSTLRATIARRMLHSVHTTAPVTLTTTVNADNLVNLREQFKSTSTASGPSGIPAWHDIIGKLAAAALMQHPQLNAHRSDNSITHFAHVDLGIAVDTDQGLVVPVVRRLDRLSLTDAATQSRRVIDRALRRECSAQELQGATFTLTNLGAWGIETFTPIINPPQVAILGIGRLKQVPAVCEGSQVRACWQMPLSLTFDHCAVDGAPAARFLQTLSGMMENPVPVLLGAG